MTNAQAIRMALAYIKMSESEFARQMGTSPQALHQRMKTDKFTRAEMEKAAEVIGAKLLPVFEFPDGTMI